MRIEMLATDHFRVFVINAYFPELDWENKEEITKIVKELVSKWKEFYHLSLQGFYKMEIYLNQQIGMIIEVKKIEDFDYISNKIDLKLVVYVNSTFFIELEDITQIKNKTLIYAYHNKYYFDIKNVANNDLLMLTEWGRVVYGEEIETIKKESKKINFLLS